MLVTAAFMDTNEIVLLIDAFYPSSDEDDYYAYYKCAIQLLKYNNRLKWGLGVPVGSWEGVWMPESCGFPGTASVGLQLRLHAVLIVLRYIDHSM